MAHQFPRYRYGRTRVPTGSGFHYRPDTVLIRLGSGTKGNLKLAAGLIPWERPLKVPIKTALGPNTCSPSNRGAQPITPTVRSRDPGQAGRNLLAPRVQAEPPATTEITEDPQRKRRGSAVSGAKIR